jgi:hypothetical protein
MSPNEFGNLVAGPGELSREESAASDLRMFATTCSNLNVWKVHHATKCSRRAQNLAPISHGYCTRVNTQGIKYGV